MSPEPTSDKVANSNQAIYIEQITNKQMPSYNDYPLYKLKSMIVSVGKKLDNCSMDFSVFKNISLDSTQLTYLPTNFAHHMYNLQTLNLSNNQLEELPHSFHQLTKLEHLNIDNNCLTSLPNSFGGLKHLKTLSLAFNQLQQLPECFSCLFNLEYLNLSQNKFSSLPVSCAMLNKVYNLILSNNKLVEMPECVTNGMKNLHHLDLSNNPNIFLNKAPASIHLTTFVAVDNNNCIFFPQWILWVKYNKLKEVNLDNTTFRRYSYPKEQTALQITKLSMRQSNLSGNIVESIISKMGKLQTLDLSNYEKYSHNDNNFWQLPLDNTKAYNNLRELNVRRTYLPCLSSSISNLSNLIAIDLSYNLITWLPKEFTMLQKLEVIHIEESKIILLPADIDKLWNLRELWASCNSISQLPNSLFALKKLEVLDMYDNMISEVPNEICEMDSLQLLDLDQNLCDVSHVVIKNISYENLKSDLRSKLDCDCNIRYNGSKVEEDEDLLSEYDHEFNHFDFYSDESSMSDNEELSIKSDEMEPKKNETNVSDSLENWDQSENNEDNFEPNNVSLYRPLHNYYHSTLANYYCPADNHEKSIRSFFAEQNLIKTDIFEDGQFDDV